jgi:hypothetical protein
VAADEPSTADHDDVLSSNVHEGPFLAMTGRGPRGTKFSQYRKE